MFNNLVVSTNERRRGRIARFFFGTSAVYAMVIAGVLALSVMVSTPKLADTGERMLALLTLPPPGPPPPPQQRDNTPPPVAPRNDPTQFRDLDHVLRAPTPERRPLAPPSINDPLGVVGAPEGNGVPESFGSLPNTFSHGDTVAPPPPRPAEPRPAPQGDTAHPVRLSTGVLQGKAIVKRTPEYPPLARQIHLAGSVSVEVMIAPDGRVEAARAINGHPLLVSAAVEAALTWRFEPTRLNGTAVRVTGVIVFNFTM